MHASRARRSYAPAAEVIRGNRAGIRRRAIMRDRIETTETRAAIRAYRLGVSL